MLSGIQCFHDLHSFPLLRIQHVRIGMYMLENYNDVLTVNDLCEILMIGKIQRIRFGWCGSIGHGRRQHRGG